MPRSSRIVIPGCAHHITQRGNNKQDVFFVDDDRRVFLDLLKQACERFGVSIDGYCLMTNHVHLLATPESESSLAQGLKWTNQLYAQYVNRLHGRTGHLWEGRFFSCALDEEHFWRALAYVERNPVRGRLCRAPWRYEWSSAAAHCGAGDPSGLLDLTGWADLASADEWRETLREQDDEAELARMRLSTSRGRPLGSDRFVAKLERLLNRRLRPLPRGRPPKKQIQ